MDQHRLFGQANCKFHWIPFSQVQNVLNRTFFLLLQVCNKRLGAECCQLFFVKNVPAGWVASDCSGRPGPGPGLGDVGGRTVTTGAAAGSSSGHDPRCYDSGGGRGCGSLPGWPGHHGIAESPQPPASPTRWRAPSRASASATVMRHGVRPGCRCRRVRVRPGPGAGASEHRGGGNLQAQPDSEARARARRVLRAHRDWH